MLIDGLLNQGNAPLLEQVAKFTARRHGLILENIANVSTPGYRQRDMSVDRFQGMLRDRVAARATAGPGAVSFADVDAAVENPAGGILFHDGNNRSMEHLASDMAKNAMFHNLAIELLRKQFQGLETALKDRGI